MAKPATEVSINQAKLSIIRADITGQATDAIVNAANSSLMGGGGVDGAIHRAGGPAILEECKQIVLRQGRLPTGKAVISGGGNLKARFVIHTVGPIWQGGNKGEPELLASAYQESLKVAAENSLGSLPFDKHRRLRLSPSRGSRGGYRDGDNVSKGTEHINQRSGFRAL